ncbi:hypothetical protein B5P43_35745 [Bacillus sp. SRB_336]|nr:hypothetical protein B5P43_35745 [Bacillus sp. SRB_336]
MAAGVRVSAVDPAGQHNPAPLAESVEDAAVHADLVLALGSTAAAGRAAGQIAPLMKAGAVYADLTTGTPATKRKLAELFADGSFADVAIIAQQTGPAADVSLAAAGTGARKFIELLGPAGVAVEYISEVPGDAAARGILRSVLDKSLAAAIIDFLWAAESLGQKDWAYQEILQEFTTSSAETAQGYLSDTAKNFKRRQMELMDALEALREAGYESTMAAPIDFTYGSLMHGKKIPFSKPK